ncbi:hypothetical protein ACIRBX_12695 [Kitasatospora sp. NPDC096147]|uniref:hypothetical protein n=1 Tax=Kitasatospora sp. NPDC096147 TaxID=3364093 RepID=UPI0037FF26CE
MSKTRPHHPDTVLRKLTDATRTHHLVRIHRTIEDTEPIEGFVLATNAAWTLLTPCHDFRLDGFTAVPTPDISKVKRTGDEDSLTIRALRRRGQWPTPRTDVDLTALPALLLSASTRHHLVGLETERDTPGALWIGAVLRIGRKTVRLHELDPDARWHDKPSKFPLTAITRIQFAGHYEQTLHEFAGPRPALQH